MYETRTMSEDDAIAFVENMRWFAGVGRIKSHKLRSGNLAVTATKYAWSMWVD